MQQSASQGQVQLQVWRVRIKAEPAFESPFSEMKLSAAICSLQEILVKFPDPVYTLDHFCMLISSQELDA